MKKRIEVEKKYIFLAAVFVAAIVSFFGEWIDAKHFSFVSYSYFLIALYLLRCYLFCLLTLGILSLCKNKISIFLESAIFSPVVIGGLFVLFGFSFNTMTTFSRVITVVQIVTVIVLLGRVILFFAKRFAANQNVSSQNLIMTPEPSQPDFSKLSNREKDVAALILEGKKTDEIAAELFISVATVKSHIQHIFGKYEVRNRMEFANKVNGK